jgi:hypothetical protein
MNKLLIITFVLTIISCQKKDKTAGSVDMNSLTVEQIDSVLTEFKFEYENPIVLDSSDFVLMPISTEFLEKRTSFSKDGYSDQYFPRFWNILFYNRITGESRFLSKNKIRISNIETNNREQEYGGSHNKSYKGKILYSIGDIDYNQDNKLNGTDPDFLFVSDLNGKNLIRISPMNEDLNYYEVIPNSNQIILNTRRDTNSDSIFNRDDELIWYKTEQNGNSWAIKEIIDSTQRKVIEHLYFEQWLTK